MTKEARLGLVLAVNLAMIAGLVVVGLLSHSLGVLSSAADYVGDAAGVVFSLVALRMSRRAYGQRRLPPSSTPPSCCSSPWWSPPRRSTA